MTTEKITLSITACKFGIGEGRQGALTADVHVGEGRQEALTADMHVVQTSATGSTQGCLARVYAHACTRHRWVLKVMVGTALTD